MDTRKTTPSDKETADPVRGAPMVVPAGSVVIDRTRLLRLLHAARVFAEDYCNVGIHPDADSAECGFRPGDLDDPPTH